METVILRFLIIKWVLLQISGNGCVSGSGSGSGSSSGSTQWFKDPAHCTKKLMTLILSKQGKYENCTRGRIFY